MVSGPLLHYTFAAPLQYPIRRGLSLVLNIFRMRSEVLSHVRLFAIPWTIADQAPPSMELSRQEFWSGLPFPSPGDLPYLEVEPRAPALQADTLLSELPRKPHP